MSKLATEDAIASFILVATKNDTKDLGERRKSIGNSVVIRNRLEEIEVVTRDTIASLTPFHRLILLRLILDAAEVLLGYRTASFRNFLNGETHTETRRLLFENDEPRVFDPSLLKSGEDLYDRAFVAPDAVAASWRSRNETRAGVRRSG